MQAKMTLYFIKLEIPLIVSSIMLRFILQEERHVMGKDMWYVFSIEFSRYKGEKRSRLRFGLLSSRLSWKPDYL